MFEELPLFPVLALLLFTGCAEVVETHTVEVTIDINEVADLESETDPVIVLFESYDGQHENLQTFEMTEPDNGKIFWQLGVGIEGSESGSYVAWIVDRTDADATEPPADSPISEIVRTEWDDNFGTPYEVYLEIR